MHMPISKHIVHVRTCTCARTLRHHSNVRFRCYTCTCTYDYWHTYMHTLYCVPTYTRTYININAFTCCIHATCIHTCTPIYTGTRWLQMSILARSFQQILKKRFPFSKRKFSSCSGAHDYRKQNSWNLFLLKNRKNTLKRGPFSQANFTLLISERLFSLALSH